MHSDHLPYARAVFDDEIADWQGMRFRCIEQFRGSEKDRPGKGSGQKGPGVIEEQKGEKKGTRESRTIEDKEDRRRSLSPSSDF